MVAKVTPKPLTGSRKDTAGSFAGVGGVAGRQSRPPTPDGRDRHLQIHRWDGVSTESRCDHAPLDLTAFDVAEILLLVLVIEVVLALWPEGCGKQDHRQRYPHVEQDLPGGQAGRRVQHPS